MSEYYKINSGDIIYRIIDNEAVILSPRTGEYYSLNKTGTFIWKLMENGIARDSLIDKVTEKFAIDKKNLIRDIKPFLKDLVLEKIIKQESALN